jgi:hypothetical protein
MIKQGDVISYIDMCKEEGVNLQRGMNFRLRGGFNDKEPEKLRIVLE